MEHVDFSTFDTITEEKSDDENQDPVSSLRKDGSPSQPTDDATRTPRPEQYSSVEAAQKELQMHELLALSSCFLFPVIGAWLLHAIRGQLSRPSEGLVSNYNLTVFLLASEIRPVSHLVKMIQARTLFLQRVVNLNSTDNDQRLDSGQLTNLLKRVEELEAHIADAAESSSKNAALAADINTAKLAAQAISETRKRFQPELDALNRAVRRYEKRTTISSLQTEARLQDLESRLKDVVVLAAAAQRNTENQSRNFMLILLNWMCAVVVVPVQSVWFLVQLPVRGVQFASDFVCKGFRLRRAKGPKEMWLGKQVRARERKSKTGL